MSAFAASIAWIRVFAADLAPEPSTRPNRTVSIPLQFSLQPESHTARFRGRPLTRSLHPKQVKGRKSMNRVLWIVGGICAAAAGVILCQTNRKPAVEELAQKLEGAWADHHTSV